MKIPLRHLVSRLFANSSDSVLSRTNLFGRLGYSYGGDRDLYEALGYKKSLTFNDFFARYERQDIAKRLINAPVEALWGNPPVLEEAERDEASKEDTEFESRFQELSDSVSPWSVLTRADKLCGIGRFSVIVIGLNDSSDLSKPVKPNKNNEVMYMQPYPESCVGVAEWETNTTSPRYSLPLMYTISSIHSFDDRLDTDNRKTLRVHWSRVLHIADDLLENNFYGTPRLQCVFNRLQDVETIVGGSAEMFWRGARPGYSAEMDPDVSIEEDTISDLDTQFQEFENQLRRIVRLQGVSMKPLAPQVESPLDHVSVQLDLISSATGIPKRILMGTERGELASSQDQNQWISLIENRRNNFAVPVIMSPLLQRLMDYQVLPQAEYNIIWPDLRAVGEKEKAEIGRIRSESLARYASTPGAEFVVPPVAFQKEFLGLTDKQIKQSAQELEGMGDEEIFHIPDDTEPDIEEEPEQE